MLYYLLLLNLLFIDLDAQMMVIIILIEAQKSVLFQNIKLCWICILKIICLHVIFDTLPVNKFYQVKLNIFSWSEFLPSVK